MKVYLIRHARTRDAEDQLTQKHTTSIIVDSETLDKVEEVKNTVGEVEAVYCSPLKRARETANLVFGEGKYEVLDYIYEYITPEEIIGKPRKFAVEFWEVKHKQDKQNIYWKPEGGESYAEIADRVERLYKFLLEEKTVRNRKSVAIVCHGTFFMHFLLCIAGIPWREYPRLIYDVLRKMEWKNLRVVEVEI